MKGKGKGERNKIIKRRSQLFTNAITKTQSFPHLCHFLSKEMLLRLYFHKLSLKLIFALKNTHIHGQALVAVLFVINSKLQSCKYFRHTFLHRCSTKNYWNMSERHRWNIKFCHRPNGWFSSSLWWLENWDYQFLVYFWCEPLIMFLFTVWEVVKY